jgi:hypothetical protein
VVTSASWALAIETPAAASTNAGLQAQANAISTTINDDGAALQVLGERYLDEQAAYARASQREATLRHAISRASAGIAQDHSRLLDAAVSAYVNAGSDGSLSLFLGGNATSLATGQTYLRVASDQLGDAATKLRDDEHSLDTSLAAERREATAASTALAATKTARATVLRTVAGEQHLLASVQGQLATLVHQEELAQERAAAAAEARAAAQARARAQAAASTTTTLAGSSPVHGTTTASGTPQAPATLSGPPAPSGVPQTDASPIPSGSLAEDFAGIRNCESSDDYGLNTGNGYYGAYQFSLSTWEGLGGAGLPSSAPPPVQDSKAYRLYQGSGWSSWPECAAVLGL